LHGLRRRRCCSWRVARTSKSIATISACWNWAPKMKPPNCSNTPMPNPAAMTPGRLPKPAAVTTTNNRIE